MPAALNARAAARYTQHLAGKLIDSEYGEVPEVDSSRVAVLFDFDGTIGDTETPAMEVAFWELAPYLHDAASDLEGQVTEYVRNNAGKAFEFMLEVCEEDRAKAGLPSIEDVRKVRDSYCNTLLANTYIISNFIADANSKQSQSTSLAKGEDAAVVKIVDEYRAKFGLVPLHSATFASLLEQQKIET
eukprot:20108-Heterococcus_DN1.PRE.1